jgi:hypothetical protein
MTAFRRRAQVMLVVAAVLGAGACGGSGSGISSAAGARLQLQVAAIRDSAAQGDRAAAESRLQQLRVDVVELRAADTLSSSAATRILHAAADVETNLSLLGPPATRTTTTTTSTTTTTKPKPPGKDKGHDKGGHRDGHGD